MSGGRIEMNHRKDLKTLTILAIGFALLAWLFDFLWLGIFGIVVLVLGLLFKQLAALFATAWMRLAAFLGLVNGTILLTLIYFLILTPIALLSRLFTKDPLQLRRPKGSNFIEREKTFGPDDLEEMW